MSTPTTPSTWHVLHQTPRTRVNGAGVVSEGYDVTITTGENHTGTVFVPASHYGDVDRVKVQLAALATQLDAVGSLNSES